MGNINPDFDGETVVITGARSGIGREIALRFADAGAVIVIGDISDEPKQADVPTQEAIRNNGGTATFVTTDVTRPGQIQNLVSEAHEFGGVDVMINNAGLYVGGSILEAKPEDFDRIHDVNAKGSYFGIQKAANDMIERGEPGSIINTASISSNHAQFNQVQYDSSKGAIRMITRGSALELAEHEIRVNAVGPGQIATEFIEGWSEEAQEAAETGDLLKDVPLGRAGTPEDVAGAYLFLASDEASYITGEMVFVDGGWQVF